MLKKNIIILAEEYWYTVKTVYYKFIEATYLLEKIKNNKKYNIVMLKTPKELLAAINSIGKSNIKCIFIFQDIFSDSYLNNKSIKEMKDFMYDLKDNYKINIYPGIEMTDNFASKKYYLELIKKMPYSVLPKSRVYKIDYKEGDDEKIIKDLMKQSTSMFKEFNKIIVKKGYSYSAVQVKILSRELLNDKEAFIDKLKKLNHKKFFDVGTNAKLWEKDISRYYILQGYNRVISNKINEFRVYFFGGVAKYVAWGDDIPNLCTADFEDPEDKFNYSSEDNNIDANYGALNKDDENIRNLNKINPALGKEILRFAKKVYSDYLKLFWKNNLIKHPILFRVDISYAIEPEFIDKYAIDIPGFETKVRLYVNELEIDPTNYFYNNIICKKEKEITTKYIQILTSKLINEYINLLE